MTPRPSDPITAQLFTLGSDRVEAVDPQAAASRVDDHSILWLDTVPAAADQAGHHVQLADAAVALTTSDRDAVIVSRADHVGLSVVALREDSTEVEPVLLYVVLGQNIVLSLHDAPIRGLTERVGVVAEDPRFGRLDAGRFTGLLLEGVLDGYDAAVEDLERDIDELDERALREKASDAVVASIVHLRRRIARLRRWLAPQRAVFAALTTPADEASPFGHADPALLAHLERTIDAVERSREQLLGTFDIVMTTTNQRTNDVMRILTVVSAVLLPSVVIAGVMGMNFPAAFFEEPAGFYVVAGIMVLLAAATLALARWRRWI